MNTANSSKPAASIRGVILAFAVAVASSALGSAASAQQAPEVELGEYEVAVYGDAVANLEIMKVRIADPDGKLVLDLRSDGDQMAWSPSDGDPDGLYRYEVVAITRDPAAGGAEQQERNNAPGVSLVRRSGSFEIRDGIIIVPRDRESSLWDGPLRLAAAVLDAIGDAVIASAHAADLTASSTLPTVEFEHLTSGQTLRAARIQATVPELLDFDRFSFKVLGRADLDEIINIDADRDADQSIVIDIDGHIALADDSVFIDRANDRIGVGTTIPLAALHVSGQTADIRMTNAFSEWRLNGGQFGLFFVDDSSGTRPLFIENDTGNNTLVLDSNERVGIGTEEPGATLEVTKGDGTSQILVKETAAITGNRTLVQLTNNGRPQVRLSNVASGVNWVTGMGSDDAYIIRRGSNEYRFTKGGRVRWFVDVGGGNTEIRFDYNNNGNLTIAGTLTEKSDVNAKRDIVPVNGAAVLARVAALPVSTWTYKNDESGARHVGPTAQDFHDSFGLGADDTSISPRDVAGVALAAVQELLRQKDAEIAALTARLAAVEARLGR